MTLIYDNVIVAWTSIIRLSLVTNWLNSGAHDGARTGGYVIGQKEGAVKF